MGRWSGRVMGQKGFFDLERRLAAISSKGDPLEAIKKIVRWEDFRADIEAMTETEPEERKSNAGRKPYDALLKFKIVVHRSTLVRYAPSPARSWSHRLREAAAGSTKFLPTRTQMRKASPSASGAAFGRST